MPVQSSSTSLEQARDRFLAGGDGLAAVAAHTAGTDRLVRERFQRFFPDPHETALLAVGGYGRKHLFPCSDVDLLFLFRRGRHLNGAREKIARLLAELWDAGLQVSQSVRTPGECTTLAPDNAELHISLLDIRYLAGDQELFHELATRLLPRFYAREQKALVRRLTALAETRFERHGGTIYHLEPNIKEAPGGLRDVQLACWLSQLTGMGPSRIPVSEECLEEEFRGPLFEAKRFLFALRCYLHYVNGRDNNTLTFDLQDRIAEQGPGGDLSGAPNAAEWMRGYFRQARQVHRAARRAIEEATPRQSLFGFLRDRKSRLSAAELVVSRGRLYFRNSHALQAQPELILELFEFLARHNVPMGLETQRRITEALPRIRERARAGGDFWTPIARILTLPHAYAALKEMHECGVLEAFFPEFEAIDCLVIRDFYHRYTVDEHTFITIRTLHELREDSDPLTARFARLKSELDRPELLYFALLFHDVGKGSPAPGHAEQSSRLAKEAMDRIGVPAEDQAVVLFLIERHLDLSVFMRTRDISEPGAVDELAASLGTPERLQALTLMTLADISAVNPKAMSAWRKDLLWQVYIAAYHFLTQEVEDRRIHIESSEPFLELAESPEEKAALRDFLEGLPRRYLRTRSAETVKADFALARTLARDAAGVRIERRHALYEAVIVTRDRPALFASLCAAFSRFGLSIQKAEAFANAQGLVLDTLVVSDPGRTLELNPSEVQQLRKLLKRVAAGRVEVSEMLTEKRETVREPDRRRVEPHVAFDNQTSALATIFYVIGRDRNGLLFDLASTFSQHGCNIEVVLIDTQGARALDTFYVVGPEGKVDPETCQQLQRELLSVCRGDLG